MDIMKNKILKIKKIKGNHILKDVVCHSPLFLGCSRNNHTLKGVVLVKFLDIIIESIPILLMIGLIPIIKNNYVLSLAYIFIIAISLYAKYEKREYVFLVAGFVLMLIFESIFLITKVEVFARNSLFGIMPLWLPFLWAYAFVAIKRVINILK